MNLAIKVNIDKVIAGFNVDVEVTENPGTPEQRVLIAPSSARTKHEAQLEALRLIQFDMEYTYPNGEIVELNFFGGMP